MTQLNHILVFDVGKTHIKLSVIDEDLQVLDFVESDNQALNGPPYLHYDIDSIWSWFVERLQIFSKEFSVGSIVVTCHGATAALINRHDKDAQSGLALPVLDYEYPLDSMKEVCENYVKLRPDFTVSGSPDLPLGLNLGRQIFWLQSAFPKEFASVTDILLYPQYWVWRMTGVRCSEITSLGCHTDLWAPWRQTYTKLVTDKRWENLFPPLKAAHENAGIVDEKFCELTGLNKNCTVKVGVHDSNASYYRYLHGLPDKQFTVLSTGTWVIALASSTKSSELDAERDMLANVDVNGNPVICSRFMGGREYAHICETTNSRVDEEYNEADIVKIIRDGVFCLPCWEPNTGPFPKAKKQIIGSLSKGVSGSALASLYCALVIDTQLELLGSTTSVFVEGVFGKNLLLCKILSQLRENQNIYISDDSSGTTFGSALLSGKQSRCVQLEYKICEPSAIAQLSDYRTRWHAHIQSSTLKKA